VNVDLLVPGALEKVVDLSLEIARRTEVRLAAEGHVVHRIVGDACVESRLVSRRPDGTAYYGHGSPELIPGSDGVGLFPGDAAERLRGRWLHAFACEAGQAFTERVLAHDPTVIVAYRTWLRTDWSFEDLPHAVAVRFDLFLTEVTSTLAAGTFDEVQTSRELQRLLDEMTEVWAVGRPDLALSIGAFCRYLIRGMVVRRT
jgi:hypothetical protein